MVQYHLLQIVKVNAPRWHDRVALPRLDKFKSGYNIMTINHNNYPGKYIVHSNDLLNYPTEVIHSKRWGDYQVKAIPLADLVTVQEHQERIKQAEYDSMSDNEQIKQTIRDLGWWN